MANKINISIPQPCHENWEAMTAVDKGKFCNSCQKQVFDFTSSSDREIINAFQKDNTLCGRFLNTQLDRDLVKPKEKSTIWIAATTAFISFIGLGTQESQAQDGAKVVQTDRKATDEIVAAKKENIVISGIVYGDNKTPVPHLGIYVGGKKIGETNENGNFSVTLTQRWWITFRNENEDEDKYEAFDYKLRSDNTNLEIDLVKKFELSRIIHVTAGGISGMVVKERTFFGRLFHRIGNLFR